MEAARSGTKGTARRTQTRGPANAEAVLAAAHRLVAERGDDFTTQDLIREADVALQTFYRHFGSKDQLLVAVIGDLISGHCESLRERAADLDDPVERLHFYVMETLSPMITQPTGSGAQFMAAQHWRLHQTYPAGMMSAIKPFEDLVQEELEAAQQAGLLQPSSPEFDAWAINKLVISVFHHYAFADEATLADTDGAAVAENVWRFCLAAVGGSPPTAAGGSRRRRRT